MLLAILRFARVLVGQAISFALLKWGGINVPIINITVGALISAVFKYLRDKYPKNPILEWLPI